MASGWDLVFSNFGPRKRNLHQMVEEWNCRLVGNSHGWAGDHLEYDDQQTEVVMVVVNVHHQDLGNPSQVSYDQDIRLGTALGFVETVLSVGVRTGCTSAAEAARC